MSDYIHIAYIIGLALYGVAVLFILFAVGLGVSEGDLNYKDTREMAIFLGCGLGVLLVFPFIPALLVAGFICFILWGVGASINEGFKMLRGLKNA